MTKLAYRRLDTRNPDLTLYLLDDEAVLFCARTKCLFGLSTAATCAFLALDQGMPAEAVVAGMAGTGSLVEDLAAMLDGEPESACELWPTPEALLAPPAVAPGEGLAYRLLGMSFLLRLSDPELKSRILPLLVHLSDDISGQWDLVVDIVPQGKRYDLLFNGVPLGDPLELARVYPMLQHRLRGLAYQRSDYLLAVHAAVVSDGALCLMMPGQSGVGKSTLTATLMARGFRLLSDETAILDAKNLRVRPVPMAIGIKESSFPVLAPVYPQLRKAPAHERFDGQAVYFLLPQAGQWMEADCAVTHLVFPSYRAGEAARHTRLGPVEALNRLTTAGYQVPGLDAGRLEALLEWLSGLRCFAINYGSTDAALEALEQMEATT